MEVKLPDLQEINDNDLWGIFRWSYSRYFSVLGADSVITAETGKAMNEHGADLYNSAKDTISNVITP